MKNLFEIRPCFYDDESEVIEIMNQGILSQSNAYVEAFDWIEGANWFKQLRASSHKLVVCEFEGKVVAWAGLSPYRSGRAALSKVNELTFYVHEDFHRRGIASRILNYLEGEAAQLGMSHLVAILLSSNKGSKALLEKHDYFVWGLFEGIAHLRNETVGHMYMGKHL